MPTYQYSCTDCGHFFEIVQSFSDDSLTVCPECEGRLRKVFNAVGVVFKGSGFYRTDSRNQKAGADGSVVGQQLDQGLARAPPARRRRARRASLEARPTQPRLDRRRAGLGGSAGAWRRPPPEPALWTAGRTPAAVRPTFGRHEPPAPTAAGPAPRDSSGCSGDGARSLAASPRCAGRGAHRRSRQPSPPPPRTVTVWTAAATCPAGVVLGPATSPRRRYAPDSVPAGRGARSRPVVGRTLAAPMRRGEPITGVRMLARGLLRGYPGHDGRAAAHHRRRGRRPAAGGRPGQPRRCRSRRPRTPAVLVRDVPVIADPAGATTPGSAAVTPGRLVVAAVPVHRWPARSRRRAATSILIPVWRR